MRLGFSPFLVGISSALFVLLVMRNDLPEWLALLALPGIVYAWAKMRHY